jgi:energy-coupling factor transporter ATP-binding protein EcfA2
MPLGSERPAAAPPIADKPVADPPVTDLPVRAPSPPTEQQVSVGLSARLMALARMIQIGSARSGRNGFSKKLLADAEQVVLRAGERMRLSSSHTVVVLAGGTGSGKSSLFNRLAGADLSTVGVTRPVTRDAHACVWGDAASGPILDWLNVPARYRYLRASALDSGEDDLDGLVLLDLPDHDSVMTHTGELVDQLVSMADVMVWVLDPQKYADAAVHRRFLVPLAGHSDVLAVVLNQSDLLDAAQVDDCAADLRRLLDSEDLHEVPILVTSAVSGAGLAELRQLLGAGVAARRAAASRISADLDRVMARFDPYAGDVGAPASSVPAASKTRLADRLAAAAGISAISDALRSARELRAFDFVGWPVAWFIQRLSGRDPIRKVRLGMLWNDLRSVTAGPAGAQQAEVDTALTDLGVELAGQFPRPWSQTVRAAVRSRADEIPAAVGSAIGEALPAEDSVVWWWRLAGLWQGLLLGTAAVGIVWLALVIAFGVFHVAAGVPRLLSDTGALPWISVGALAALGLGAATASACMRLVASTTERENTEVTADMRERIAGVADTMVVMPAELELAEFGRYREEARIASRDVGTDPAS